MRVGNASCLPSRLAARRSCPLFFHYDTVIGRHSPIIHMPAREPDSHHTKYPGIGIVSVPAGVPPGVARQRARCGAR